VTPFPGVGGQEDNPFLLRLVQSVESRYCRTVKGNLQMLRKFLAALAVTPALAAPAHATQICAWLAESNEPENVRVVTLWLQSDAEVSFLYKVGGKGIITHSGESNAPASATFNLHADHPETPWHYGATLDSAARIDISVEIRAQPTDIFSDTPSPLLASFAFARAVPENEKTPPATLAKKQCATITLPAAQP